MWSYTPELPRNILAQAVGLQGDRTRLERFIAKLMAGERWIGCHQAWGKDKVVWAGEGG